MNHRGTENTEKTTIKGRNYEEGAAINAIQYAAGPFQHFGQFPVVELNGIGQLAE